MDFLSHLFTFFLGVISTLLALVAIFYLFLLNKISKNRKEARAVPTVPNKTGSGTGVFPNPFPTSKQVPHTIKRLFNRDSGEQSSGSKEKKKESKKKKDKDKLDPIRAAILNKESELSKSTLHEELLRCGYLKIRGSLNVWWNRYVELRSGRLVYFKSDKAEDCFGLLLLDGCEVKQRVTSKKGFCFVVSHPLGKSIYSNTGLRGEQLSSKIPSNVDVCMFRAKDEAEGALWMEAIISAMKTPPLSRPELDLPTIINREEIKSDGEKTDDEMYSHPAGDETHGNLLAPPSTHKKSNSRELSATDITDLIRNSDTPPSTENLSRLKAEKPPTSKSSESIPPLEAPKPVSSKGSLRVSTGYKIGPDGSEKRDETIEAEDQILHLPKVYSVPSFVTTPPMDDTYSEASEDGSFRSIDPSEEGIDEDESKYREGWLDIQLKRGGWKPCWIIVKRGLLTYYQSEKSSDCDGLIDLVGCAVKIYGENIEISHSSGKPILLVVKSPDDDSKTEKSSLRETIDTTKIVLKAGDSGSATEWGQLIDIMAEIPTEEPLMVPRFDKIEGKEEKCHWFNAFIQRYFKDMENSETLKFMFERILSRKFERVRKPDFIGSISILDLNLGKEMIKVNEAVIEPTSTPNELIGEAEIIYKGGASLTLSTEFYINWPSYRWATIPILISVKCESMSGRVTLYGPPQIFSRFSLSFRELPKCSFDVNLTVGTDKYHYDISKISKVSDFIVSMLEKVLWKNTVTPNRITFQLPLPGKKLAIQTKQFTSRSKHQRVSIRPIEKSEDNS